MLNKIIYYSLHNRLIILTASILLMVAGIFVTSRTEVDVFPDLNAPTVVVMTEASGLAAEEVEQLVTFPIETSINGAAGVRRVRSSSTNGFSIVWVEFDWDTDVYLARQIVSERLATVSEELPDNVNRPVMGPQSSILGEVLIIGLTADSTSMMDLRTLADWTIRPRLLSTGGVAQVAVLGGDVKEFQILLDHGKMKHYGVTLQEVMAVTEEMNRNENGGVIYEYGNEYIVRGMLSTTDIEQLSTALVKKVGDMPVLLRDVAEVKIGYQEPKLGTASVRGKNAVLVTVTKQPETNTLELTEKLEAAMDRLPFPVILKAVDLMGSRGIFRSDTREEARANFRKSLAASGKDYCLIEEFIEGELFGVEAMVQNGKFLFVLPNNTEAFPAAVPTPVGHSVPFRGLDRLGAQILEQTEKAVKALGLDNCPVNCDFIRKDGKVYVVELTGRSGATGLSELTGIYYGLDYYEMLVRLAMGEDLAAWFDEPAEKTAVLTHTMLSDREGMLRKIWNENRETKGVKELSFNVKPGDSVRPYTNGRDRIGQVILAGESLPWCERRLKDILNHIRLELEGDLPLGRTRAEQGAPRDLQVRTGKIEVVIDAEVFLLQTGKGHDGQRRLNAEELEHALCLTIQSLTGTQQRRFLVQRDARPRQKHGGDAQERAVGVFHDIGGARHIPGRIAAGLEGGAQAAGGEGGSVRFAPDKHGAGKFRDDAAGGVGRKEAVVLLGGLAGQRIENMGEVGRALFNGPVLHNRRHGIRNGRVHAFAEGDGLVQGLVHGLGETLAHHLVVEDVAAEKVRGLGFRKIERRGIGLVGRNGLNGMLPGDIAAHESLVMVVFGARGEENSPDGGFHESPAQAAPFHAAAAPPERRSASRAAFMRRSLIDADDLDLKRQGLARQRMVGIQRQFIVRDFGNGDVHLPFLVGKLQRHAHLGRNVIRHLRARHGENQFGIQLAIGFARRNDDFDHVAHFVILQRFLKAGNQHALAHDEFQRVALARGIEHRSVVQRAHIMHAQGIALLDSHINLLRRQRRRLSATVTPHGRPYRQKPRPETGRAVKEGPSPRLARTGTDADFPGI